MEEPIATPRPCPAPHTAPVGWLKPAATQAERYDPGILPPPPERADDSGAQQEPQDSVLRDVEGITPEEQHRQKIVTFLADYEQIAPEQERRDGWTPFLRKLFLQVIAEGRGITAACEYTGMSRSSAYSLEARDRVFGAGWAAASHFARNPMAEDFYEKARDGITETITRSDGVTITRHRFDTRLSIAVLNRLDKRCDRAEERGALHLAAVRNWDEYLRLLGDGDDKAAEALLDRPARDGVDGGPLRRHGEEAKECPTCPLPVRANPILPPHDELSDLAESIWKLGDDGEESMASERGCPDGTWMTSFPPPPGFGGYESRAWTGEDTSYERSCTAEEAELIDAHDAEAEADDMAEWTAYREAERDKYFRHLRTKLSRSPAKAGAQGSGNRCLTGPPGVRPTRENG